MGLFSKASARLNLTPFERAILRALEGLVITALVAAITAIAPLLAGGSVNWSNVLHVAIAAATVAVGMALSKYFKAFGDAPLPTASDTVAPAPQPAAPQAGA